MSILLPMLYYIFCCLFTLFRIKIFSLIEIFPGSTDGYTLTVLTLMLMRIVPPLTWNYYNLIFEAAQVFLCVHRHRSFGNVVNTYLLAMKVSGQNCYRAARLWRGSSRRILPSFVRRPDPEQANECLEHNGDGRP